MNRDHRPRGYRWNCPSDFQQTETFRHIRYDDCLAPNSDRLCPEEDDDFPSSDRASKKRRIEKLADDFLNGARLEIHSAQLNPQALRLAVAYSSFARPKDFGYTLEECDLVQNDSAAMWEDVEDDGEIIRNALKRGIAGGHNGSSIVINNSTQGEQVEISVTEAQAQANCGPKRQLRCTASITVGPSDEALRKAAELRNRRLRNLRSYNASMIDSQPQSCPRPTIPETQEQSLASTADETASDCGPSPTPAWTSRKWRETGTFKPKPPRKGVDEDCSRDELGASSVFALSQSKGQLLPLARGNSGSITAGPTTCSTAPSDKSTSRGGTSFVVCETSGQSAHDISACDNIALACVDGTEDSNAIPDDFTLGDTSKSQEDSQQKLSRVQGLCSASRKSWTAMNDITEQTEESTMIANSLRSPGAEQRACTLRAEAQELVKEDNFERKGQKPKIAVSRRLRTRGDYSSVEVKGSSPFVYRKRAAKPDSNALQPKTTSLPKAETAKTQRCQVSFLSPDAVQVAMPALHTPLVDEHLNRILPQEAGSGRQSSSVRKALREELKASGADLSRCEGENGSQPEKSPLQATARNENDGNSFDCQEPPRPETQWPGTQAALTNAQHDLFTSPDKTDAALGLDDETTPQAVALASQSAPGERKALKQLSQETVAPPLPSTQALIQDWQGWSSIKKPRSARKRTSSLPSPTPLKDPTSLGASDHVELLKQKRSSRRSSLRFSLPLADSPRKPTSLAFVTTDVTIAPDPLMASIHDLDHLYNDSLAKQSEKYTKGIFSSMRLTAEVKNSPNSTKDADCLVKASALSFKRRSSGLKSALSFGISSMELPTQCHDRMSVSRDRSESNEHDESTILPLDSQNHVSSYQNAQQVLLDEDSQDLAVTITEKRDECLGTAGTTDTFSF